MSALVCAALAAGSCAKEVDDTSGEGCLRMTIDIDRLTRAETETYDPTERSVLRIRNAGGELIRKYEPAKTRPDNLYLVGGDYKLQYESSDGSQATWDHLSYAGEKDFTITPHQTTVVEMKCPIVNSGVKVTFDPSVAEKLEDFRVYVCASDEFSYHDADNGTVPTLRYDADRTGFFLLPEGVSKLSWGFYGKCKDTGADVAVVSTTGHREIVPEAGMLYSLDFKFSNTPDGGLNISVVVEEEGELVDRTIFFSPQPAFAGDGFSIGSVSGYAGGDMSVKVSAINALRSVKLLVDDGEYELMNSTKAGADGATFALTDECNGVITLSEAFLSRYGGGIHTLGFKAVDAAAVEGQAKMRIAVQGLFDMDAAHYDLWQNTAELRAAITDDAARNVVIKYRRLGASEWTSILATEGADYTYSALVTPEWSSKTVNGHTVYTLEKGISAKNTYEYVLSIDGKDGAVKQFATETAQTIPHGDMESEALLCFTTDGSKNAPYWGSGNNSMTPSLCTSSSFPGMGGSHCAKLQATSTLGFMAAGNLFMGTFERPGMNGFVDFGHKYAWQARPAALKLKLHATLGNVNINKHNGPLPTGRSDVATVYVAVVDWNAKHRVTSGTASPTGIWSPADGPDAVSEGKIIGYGLLDITQSTAGGSMAETTIPIVWYDRETKPAGNYTLVISCSTSKYGDYMDGCDKNTLYVDDFEWSY